MDEYSDEMTGLPPLEKLDSATTLLALRFVVGGEGLVSHPEDPNGTVVRFVHVRGLVEGANPEGPPEYAQVHLALPARAVQPLIDQLRFL